MKISKKKIYYLYMSLMVIFTSWIIFYTIPRELQYVIFFIPAILIIHLKYYPYSKERFLAFGLFGIILLRYSIPESISLADPTLYATLIRSLLLASMFLISKGNLTAIYEYFKKVLAIIILVSLPFYLLYISGLYPFGSFTTFIGGDGVGRTWNVYLFFSLQDHPISGEILRFPAIFDEPGYLGTILSFILVIEKLNIKDRKNQLFLLTGLLTFSLAFYLIMAVYYLLTTTVTFKRKVIAGGLAFAGILIILSISPNIFYERIIERIYSDGSIVLTESGRVGAETQENIVYGLQSLNTNQLLFGIGYAGDRIVDLNLGTNWSSLPMQIGIIFFAMLISLILYFARHSIQTLLFALLFILSILQRPAIFAPIWFFLLVCGISKYLHENIDSNTNT